MENKLIDFGFVAPESIEPEEYVLGAVTEKVILQPDGQWDEFLPEYEAQFNENFDSAGCTCWGSENQIEIVELRAFGIKSNYSERFPYNIVGIRPPGTDPQKVYEAIRKYGLCDDRLCPLTADMTYEEFTATLPCSLFPIAEKWLDKYDFKHEWLWISNQTKEIRTRVLKDTLPYCPVAVSVTAWIKEGDVYVDRGQRNTHWCVIFGFTDQGWKVFDSYDHSIKIVSFDHNIQFAKAIYLTKRTTPRVKISGSWFADFLGRLFGKKVGVACVESGEFTRDLSQGSTGYDVMKLQQKLNEHVDTMVAKFGAGSPGMETKYFGPMTKAALIKWQRKHGLLAEGYFGPISRAIMNNLKPMTNSEKLAELAKQNLGTDFTDDLILADDVSCVFAVSSLLKVLDPQVPIMKHTTELQNYCKTSGKFERITEPQKGCVILTADNVNTRRDIVPMGHAGVYIDDFKIASNSSETGKFNQNYDRLSWRARYFEKGKYDVQLYKLI